MPDKHTVESIIQPWVEYFEAVYHRKPNIRERECFMLGCLEGMRSLADGINSRLLSIVDTQGKGVGHAR